MKSSVGDRIMQVYASLSPGERKMADYVLEYTDKIPRMSTLELKAATGVAEPTIFRFCKRIGFTGIKELKLFLAQYSGREQTEKEAPDFEHSGLQELVYRSLEAERRIIKNTQELMDYEIFEKVADIMVKAERICLFGIGASYLVCNDAHRKLQPMSMSAWAFNETTDTLALMRRMKNTDVVFCVSHSGASAATLQVMRDAKRLKLKTVLMTSFPQSQCAKYADLVLKTYAPEIPGSRTGISSRVSQFAVFDALYLMIVYRKDPEIRAIIEKTNADIFGG